MKVLDKTFRNTGRQIELDIARGLAVIFMVLIHVQEYFSTNFASESILGQVIDFLGGVPAAPVFMFLMGIGVIYSKNNTTEKMIKKGLFLILTGYTLNLLRGTLPNLLHCIVWKDVEFMYTAFNELIYVDIFQFSGLALILLAIVKKFEFSIRKIGILTLIFGVLNYLTHNIVSNNFLASAVSGLFIGSNEFSFFPFLTWIFYPLTGYIFGYYLISCESKEKFYRKSFVLASLVMGSVFFISNYIVKIDIGLENALAYYHHQLLGNIVFGAFVVAWISVLFFISKYIPNHINTVLSRWSRNVTEIYIIHWLFIGWIVATMGYNTLTTPYYLVMVALILVSSDFLADYYRIIKIQKGKVD